MRCSRAHERRQAFTPAELQKLFTPELRAARAWVIGERSRSSEFGWLFAVQVPQPFARFNYPRRGMLDTNCKLISIIL